MATKSILVIDDDQDVLDLVRALLSSEDYDLDLVANEDEMLVRLTGGAHYDLIVTDVWMPWMSGMQVAQFAEVAGHGVPVLFMSAFADPSLEKRVRIFGEHTRLLRKPFDVDTLRGAIDDLLYPDDEQRQRRKKALTSTSAASRSGS